MSERHEIQTRRSRGLDQSPRGTSSRRRNRRGADDSAPAPRGAEPQPPTATPETSDARRSPYAETPPSHPSPYGGAPASAAGPHASPYGDTPAAGTAESHHSPYASPYADLGVPAGPVEPAHSPYTDELALAGAVTASGTGTAAGAAAPVRRRDRRVNGADGARTRTGRTGQAVELDVDLDDTGASGEVVELDLSRSSRSGARQQRADARRAQRIRNRAAVGVAVASLGVVAAITGILPFSDHITTVSDDHMAATPTPEESRSQSPLPELSPTQAPSATPSLTPSASGSPSPSGSGSPSPSGSTTGTGTSSSSKGRKSVTLGGRTVGGWYAGASGVGVTDGKFEDWLGQPVTVAATWADTSDEVQRTLSGLSEYRDWKGALDIAVGGTVLGSGENYASAASGAYDDRWRAAAQVLADTRKGATGPTFIRPFHEMNGNWYDNWVVTKSNSADYKKAFARMAGIFRQAMPSVYVVFSPNFGDHTGLPIDYWYPGDSVVDVIGVDYYDDGSSDARVSVSAWNSESDDRDDNGNPFGPESWRQFAKQHGKPLSFPEYGLKPEGAGTDHPEWIKAFNAWMNKNANSTSWRLGEDIPSAAAGKVIYSCYFNVVHEGNEGFTIYGTGANPESASVFPKLKWGNRAG